MSEKSHTKSTEFDHYLQLLTRVDQKFKDVQSKYPKAFSCQSGCFGCCKSDLTVTNVEAAAIESWLRDRPEVLQTVRTTIKTKVHGAEYCGYLDDVGRCQIYEARPVVCRSHGAPTLVPNEAPEEGFEGDVCPLNFQDVDLRELTESDWIRLDTLNLMLAGTDREFDNKKAGSRSKIEKIPDTIE